MGIFQSSMSTSSDNKKEEYFSFSEGGSKRGYKKNITANDIIEDSTRALAADEDVRKIYRIECKIGSGQYGEVYKATHIESGVEYAIKKIIKKKVRKPEVLRKEMECLLQVMHPNVVNVVDLVEDKDALHIVQELCSGKELFDRLTESQGGLQEKEVARIISQILSGIAHCHHEVGIVHRDLKPENIIFKSAGKDSEIVIIDFGLSETVATHMSMDEDLIEAQHDHLRNKVGTSYYIAPEVLSLDYSRSCDIWSIGIICYVLLCGYPPYNGDNDNEIMKNVRKADPVEFDPIEWDRISVAAKEFVRSLLQKDPEQRPTAYEALEDRWFQLQQAQTMQLCKKIAPRLEIFHSMNKLKKMAAMVIVEEGTITEIEELKNIFLELDVDGSGTISLEELRSVLKGRNKGTRGVDIDFETLYNELDQDAENEIDYDEFLAAAISPTVRRNAANVKIAFDYFDTDHKGYITAADLGEMVGSSAQARLLIGEADYDHDQKIDIVEFEAMMTKPDFKSLLSDKCISDNKIELIANEWNNPKKDSMEQVLSISPPKNNKTLGMKFIVMFANSEQQVMVIHTVSQKSLAEKAGVKPLHVLLKINGASTTQMTEQDAIVAFDDALKKKTGFTVTVGILPSSQTFQRAIGSNVEGLRFSPRTQRVRKSFVQEQEKINRQINDGGS